MSMYESHLENNSLTQEEMTWMFKHADLTRELLHLYPDKALEMIHKEMRREHAPE